MRKICFFLILMTALALGYTGLSYGASSPTNNDYCVYPLYSNNAVKPNILIVMDFSGSMQFPAYLVGSLYTYNSHDVAVLYDQTISTTTNYDKRYQSTRDYYGLFETDKYYKQTSSRYVEDSTCGTYTNRIGITTCVSGNFLNWLTATRIDVARKALTGGRNSTGSGVTYLESEGAVYVVNDYINSCKYTVSSNSSANRQLTIANLSGTCVLGTTSSASIFAVTTGTISGLVQDFSGKAYMEFMVFSTGTGTFNRIGTIKSDKDATISSLVNAINNELPYWGTPTGEALWEAYDFFKQSNDHTYSANSSSINKGNGTKDPYYDGSGTASTAIPCRKAFVLLISDGAWSESVDPIRVARTLRTSDLRSDLTGTQNVTTYAVYAFGDDVSGAASMKGVAMFGGFDWSSTDTWPYPYTAYPSDSRNVSWPLTQCDTPTRWDTKCVEWDKNKENIPYNYFQADDGNELKGKIEAALSDMLRRASSGTAASVLASAEGSGANILQAFFFPQRMFEQVEITWTGELQNLWYYIDPAIGNSTIREDTSKNSILDIYADDIIEYEYDTGLGKTMVRRYTVNSSAQKGTEDAPSPVDLDETANLWEAGILLWARDLSTSPRTIYTTVDGTNLISFSTTQAASNSTLQTYLQASSATEAQNIVNYVHGYDISGYRNRTITTTYNSTSATNVWKLGDIVSSTPKLKSTFALNSYHLYPSEGYNDRTYYQYVNDVDASGNSAGSYKTRGMVFVGANDGMLHAFELGKLSYTGLTSTQAAKLSTVDVALGTERWAYVPKGALPYLKYLMSTSYCHVFFVDQPVYIVDASVGTGSATATKTRASWKTIVIGGMGIGGGCRDTSASCTNCVKTPVSGAGYSSYFAFDITDPLNPVFLWEFSNSTLGFSTTGPAIVRVGDPTLNGKWYAVFGSGPTGPVNTTYHQFMGSSDQTLKFFVVDLLSGSLTATLDTGISNAFGGALSGSVIDVDRGDPAATGATPYQDDAIYSGFTKLDSTTWTKGGIVRILTHHDSNPNNWSVSTLIDNIGPVTAGLSKLQDRKNGKLWLYFGTGRYYYRLDDGATLDDADSQQAFYGIEEPCYDSSTNQMFTTCSTQVSASDLVAGSSSAVPSSKLGWYINFPTPDTGYKAHRVLTSPVASYNGVVYFLTSSLSTDVCSLGGYTYLWAVQYNTGGPPSLAALSGMVVTQLSTGQIATPVLKSSGTSNLTLSSGRAMAIGQGISGGGFSLLGAPKPIRKILHMKER